MIYFLVYDVTLSFHCTTEPVMLSYFLGCDSQGGVVSAIWI